MKKITIFFFVLINFNLYGQEGYFKVPSKFYSQIDSTRKLSCCDSFFNGIALKYDIPLYEYPLSQIDLHEYETKQMEDGYIDFYVHELVDSYYKIHPTKRAQITKTCYKLSTDYKIHKNITEDSFYWIEGTLKVTIIFQSPDPNFGLPWWKKILHNRWN